MPILTKFPGGGAISAGYKYQIGDASGIIYSTDAEGNLFLNWSDPEDVFLDGRAISEWKGTLVVCKEGSAPKSVDDGIIICNSTVRDQYKDEGFPVNVGGLGYHYGVFPYTEDRVVNAGVANTVCVSGEGYKVALDNASWADIAYIAERGMADQVWKVGDEKEVALGPPFNVTIHLQIAGFWHDESVDGDLSNITFINKELFTTSDVGKVKGGESETNIAKTVLPRVEDALPDDLRNLIKNVHKKRVNSFYNAGGAWGEVVTVEKRLFTLSLHELGFYYGTTNNVNEGSKYPIFDQGGLAKRDLDGNAGAWWTCDAVPANPNSIPYVYYWYKVKSDGRSENQSELAHNGVVFGFCI